MDENKSKSYITNDALYWLVEMVNEAISIGKNGTDGGHTASGMVATWIDHNDVEIEVN